MIAVTWIQPRPKKHLGFHAFDVELDLAELGVNSDAQLDEIEHLGVE